MENTRKLTISSIVIAIYIILMFATQGFAFGAYQIRIATSLYSLSYLFPFLIVPLGIANLLSNTLMGGLGLFDIVGGITVGVITSTLVYMIRRFKLNQLLVAVPIIFGPGLIVPLWLSPILGLPYSVLAISLCVGQILPGIVGVLLIRQLERVLPNK